MAHDPPADPSLMIMASKKYERAKSPERKFIKFNKMARDEYLKVIREQGLSRSKAAEAIGIDRTTIWQYRQAHPTFNDEITEAERGAVEVVEDALYQQCQKGNVRAIEFFLCNRASDRWSNQRREPCRPQAEPNDITPLVMEVLDAHPEAQADLLKRLELTSP